MPTSDTQTITIGAPASAVLDLVADARRLPDWAPAFARSVRADGDGWIVDSDGTELSITVRVAREVGTVDFLARGLPEGVEVGAFARVIPNGEGADFQFTQFFGDDERMADVRRRRADVAAELETVRALCEG